MVNKNIIRKIIDNKKRILTALYFPAIIFYLEIIFKFFGLNQEIDGTIIYLVLFSVAFGLLLNFISTLFNKKINRIISIFFVIFLCFAVTVQFIYYKLFYTPMVLYSVTGAGQVLEFADMVFEAIINNFAVLILLLAPTFGILFGKAKDLDYKNTFFKQKIITILSIVLVNVFMLMALSFGGKDVNSDYDIYYGTNVPDLVINRFGILKVMQKDLGSIIFKNATTASSTTDLNKYIDDEDTPPDISIQDDFCNIIDIPNDDNVERLDTSPNIMDIDFDKLIESETNENIIAMHKYFSSVEPTNKNEYTGIFKGYNLILITAEGFSHLALDKELTPTLYKMANESFVFNNFYNPIWGVSTSDGEYVACQGLIPKSGVWSFYTSGENYLPFVMGNQFKKLGYSTRAYHNHYFDYYRRDVSHPNLGYDYKGLGNGLEVKETWPESDLEMIDLTVPEYINDEKFHTYYMTVSGHKNYSFYGNYIADKNKELVKNLEASEPIKAYLACNIELDRAMETLIKQLEEKGIADKTVIAISADHYPYGLEKEEIDELTGHEVENNFELYKSSFILWTKGRETVIVDKPCSSLDIIPTLSNLFGLEYDSRLLMGRDIFSTSDPLVVFSNRSFITDKAMYNSVTKEVINLTDNPIEEDYIKNINKEVSGKFVFSAEILDRDYYSHVFKEGEK